MDAGGEFCVRDMGEACKALLLHDAPEFLVSDLNGAVKQDMRPMLVGAARRASAAIRGRSRFDLLEDRAEAAIAKRFGFDSEAYDDLIHEADVLACAYEMAYDGWAPEAQPPEWLRSDEEVMVIYMPFASGMTSDEVTQALFLSRAAELGIR